MVDRPEGGIGYADAEEVLADGLGLQTKVSPPPRGGVFSNASANRKLCGLKNFEKRYTRSSRPFVPVPGLL